MDFFTSLPDLAHATIASFLPDGDHGTDNRLRVSEVSRELRKHYGGSLVSLSISYKEGGSTPLVALLRRQKHLKTVVVNGQKALPAQGHEEGLLPTFRESGPTC